LNSTVVKVRHDGPPATAKEIEVTYVQQGRLYTVRAAHCILACWHRVIPYLNTELPAAQVSAEKVPIVYTNLALRNWESFVSLQTHSISAPGCYFTGLSLDHRVSNGGYQSTKRPEEPIVIVMQRYECMPGLPARSQHEAGRADLYATSFETFERKIRDQLARCVGSGGLGPAHELRRSR
jgi:spermidine dehydrogenase